MPIPAAVWVARMLSAAAAVKNTKVFRKMKSKVGIDGSLGMEAGKAAAKVAIVTAVATDPNRYVTTAVAGAGPLIEKLVELVTGLDVPDGGVGRAVTGPTNDVVRQELGGIFTKLLDDTLQLPGVREGFLNRNSGPEETKNMARMVGAAFRMQLGDMVADWAGRALPFGVGDAFTQIAERIDKAINLDDAIEEIIQVPMQAVITRGLEQYYNRELKPQDFTESEVRQALLQERIDKVTYDKVLDNQGVRDDIRETLLQMAAPDLTESDIDQSYQHNLLSREQVKEHYKGKGFREPERELKVRLVEGTRRWKLEEKVFELYGNLYRDGVATRDEVRPHLEHFGYDADEVEMWFQVQELERRQRKWISDGNLIKLVTAGATTMTDAIAYLTLQGMEVNDAITLMNLAIKEEKQAKAESIERKAKAVINKLPKVQRDKCQELFSPEKILGELLAELIAMIPVDPTGLSDLVDLKDLIECALKAVAGTPANTP
jgi:hypothetical protein